MLCWQIYYFETEQELMLLRRDLAGYSFLPGVKLADVMDEDGGAFIVHAGTDDYVSQPSGNAGDRIACGVFKTTAPSN